MIWKPTLHRAQRMIANLKVSGPQHIPNANVTKNSYQKAAKKSSMKKTESLKKTHKIHTTGNSDTNINKLTTYTNTATYTNFKFNYILQLMPDVTRIQLCKLWQKQHPHNTDIIIKTPTITILKTNSDQAEQILTNLINTSNTIKTFKEYTPNKFNKSPNKRSEDSYSFIITGVEREINDEDIAAQLLLDNRVFRYCKRIISKQTNLPTSMIRIITGDLKTFEKILATGGFFYMNRMYRIIPSNSPKPQPLPCGKCTAFDHTTESCKAPKKCNKCQGQHDTNTCTSPIPAKCAACNSEQHAAWSPRCPKHPATPQPGLPIVKIKNNNKKSADLPKDITKSSRVHAPITVHDFIINKYTNSLNNPKHTNRDELIQKLRKRFIRDFDMDTRTMFTGNFVYILMFDLKNSPSLSPTEPTDDIRQTVINLNNG